jgi:hypothetical protein
VSVVVGMHFFVVRRQGLTSATELTHTTTNFELNFEFKVELKLSLNFELKFELKVEFKVDQKKFSFEPSFDTVRTVNFSKLNWGVNFELSFDLPKGWASYPIILKNV